jgi:tRNA threonylcarbamoyladenosine modification (KEOPS) complex  Pcc1 subunit
MVLREVRPQVRGRRLPAPAVIRDLPGATPRVACHLSLYLGRERASLYAKALKPDAGVSGRGATVRVSGVGGRLKLEIESDSISHVRAALSTHASLLKCLHRVLEATTDNLLHGG